MEFVVTNPNGGAQAEGGRIDQVYKSNKKMKSSNPGVLVELPLFIYYDPVFKTLLDSINIKGSSGYKVEYPCLLTVPELKTMYN